MRLLVGLPLLMGCGSGGDAGPTDVESLPELALVEELRVGSTEDAETGFSRIGDVVVDRDGNTYVADLLSREIRVFDREGNRLRTIGSQGDGPGQFGAIRYVAVIGDTLWVSDPTLRRVSFFNLDGTWISSSPWTIVPVATPAGVTMNIQPGRLGPDGRPTPLVTWSASPRFTPPDAIPYPRVRFDLDATLIDTVAIDTMPVANSVSRKEIALPSGNYPAPIAPPTGPITLPLADGEIIVDRRPATTADRDSFTVTRTRSSGDTVYVSRLAYLPKPYEGPAADAVARPFAASFATRSGLDVDVVTRMIIEAMDLPPFQPPVGWAQLGADESVWLRRDDDGGPGSFLVLRPDGRPAGDIHIPRASYIPWASLEEVWIVETDQFDVPWLVRYSVQTPSR